MKSWIKAILFLPCNVLFIIPVIILHFSHYRYVFVSFYQIPIGIILMIAGLFFLVWTIKLFATIGKGTLAPWAPTQKLIIEGPYKYVRNPMITGVLLILAGEVVFLYSKELLYWAVFFFILNAIYFPLSEEKGLLKRFGMEYEEYKKHVPRWIPRLTPYSPSKDV